MVIIFMLFPVLTGLKLGYYRVMFVVDIYSAALEISWSPKVQNCCHGIHNYFLFCTSSTHCMSSKLPFV